MSSVSRGVDLNILLAVWCSTGLVRALAMKSDGCRDRVPSTLVTFRGPLPVSDSLPCLSEYHVFHPSVRMNVWSVDWARSVDSVLASCIPCLYSVGVVFRIAWFTS